MLPRRDGSDIPREVRHQAKRSFINLFAVALAGCRTEPVEIALGSLREFSGGKQATVIGRAERIDALRAAFLNAAAANVHDFCDTHLRTVIHPTAPVAPAVLALAELRKVSGPELLLAFILGNEVQARIGLAISPQHYDKGWHITSTCGVFGAAAASGKLLGLERTPARLRARHGVDAIRRPLRMSGHAGQKCQRRQCRAQRVVVGAAGARRALTAPPNRSPDGRAFTMRWAMSRTCRWSPTASAKPSRSWRPPTSLTLAAS